MGAGTDRKRGAVRFGPFELDLNAGELRKYGKVRASRLSFFRARFIIATAPLMQENMQLENTSRRTLLKQLATAASAAFPILGQNPPPENHHSPSPVTKQEAAAYQYRYFAPDDVRALDALTETIIPADEHSPGASAARVCEYLDVILGDASPETKDLWKQGIALANELAANSFGKMFADCSAEERTAILSELAGSEDPHGSVEERFFHALKRAAIDGYYTSKIGIHQDLDYQGNEALHDFPGCQHAGAL